MILRLFICKCKFNYSYGSYGHSCCLNTFFVIFIKMKEIFTSGWRAPGHWVTWLRTPFPRCVSRMFGFDSLKGVEQPLIF